MINYCHLLRIFNAHKSYRLKHITDVFYRLFITKPVFKYFFAYNSYKFSHVRKTQANVSIIRFLNKRFFLMKSLLLYVLHEFLAKYRIQLF